MSSDDVLLSAVTHAPPESRSIPFEFRVLIMKFRMFKNGEVVGEVEKVAVAKHIGGNRYEYSTDISGCVFDSCEVVVKDMNGNEICRGFQNISLERGQVMICKHILKVI